MTVEDLLLFPEPAETKVLAEALLPVLYDDLRRLARLARRRAGSNDTLQTTALVHEAYLKLRNTEGFADERHFMRASAIAMRHILVNNARARLASKRGGEAIRIALHDDIVATDPADDALLVGVNDALVSLAHRDAELARVIECRFFAGYTEAETAEILGVSERTVRRYWIKARALLLQAMGGPMTAPELRP